MCGDRNNWQTYVLHTFNQRWKSYSFYIWPVPINRHTRIKDLLREVFEIIGLWGYEAQPSLL
jgi:hypothetical protein